MRIMSKIKIFKRLKPGYSNNKLHQAFDIETEQKQMNGYIKQKFLMGGIVESSGYKVFWDKEKMAKYLLSRKFANTRHWATNLEFDFMHIFEEDLQVKNMFLLDHNGFIYAKYSYPLRYKVNKLVNKKYSTKKIEFLDTANFTGKIKLSKMGQQINLPKLSEPKCFKRKPKNTEEEEELILYNKRDCEITYYYSEKLRQFYNSLGCKQKITLASTGQDLWRRSYMPQDIFQEPRHIILKHYQGSFHGGRTELFKRGLFGRLYYYDFNSHYPACCHDGVDGKGSYPDPSTSHFSKEIDIEHIRYYDGITNIEATVPDNYIQPLGLTYQDKYIFPSGKIKGWFCNIEIKEALKHGLHIDKIHEGIFYKKYFTPFKEAVKDLYKLRMQYDSKDVYYSMVKTLMNAGLFGKFGQKIDTKTNMYSIHKCYINSSGQLVYKQKNNKEHIIKKHNIRGKFIFEKEISDLKIPVFIQPILASYTAALGRIKLFKYMIKYPKDIVYCDTDSIVMKRRKFESSKKLGELELEDVSKEAVFIRPKEYRFIGNKKMYKFKGIGKFINDEQSFNDLLMKGYVDTMRFTKIKESAVRKIPFSSIIDVRKFLNFQDSKRYWAEDFKKDIEQDSRPLIIGR